MGDLLLVRLDPAITKTLENDAEYLEAAGQGDWPRVAGVVQRVLGRTLEADPVSVDQLDWGGYYAVRGPARTSAPARSRRRERWLNPLATFRLKAPDPPMVMVSSPRGHLFCRRIHSMTGSRPARKSGQLGSMRTSGRNAGTS